MAVPVTDRTSPDFSSEGIINAAVLGLTDPRFNTNTNLEFIPNMDGFPNGRRLEDDVTRIELQVVSGAALAAVGLWYDDYVIGNSPLTRNYSVFWDTQPVSSKMTPTSAHHFHMYAITTGAVTICALVVTRLRQ